jgi:PadR family transcriptional regulator, regulatory protein PadR
MRKPVELKAVPTGKFCVARIGEETAAVLGVEYLQLGCRQPTPRDTMTQRYRNRIELLQGTLDLLILQTLRWGAQHGYGIALAIRANSGEVLQVDTGSLYPALHRLERQKLIAAEWKISENKQRVRVYRLSAAGKKKLTSERSRWAQISQAIAGILSPAGKESEA